MNFDNGTRTLAEMFADMADIFSESVDVEGLHMLLTYCLQLTELNRGRIILDSFTDMSKIEVSERAITDDSFPQSQYLADRARFTLQTEVKLSDTGEDVIGLYVFPLRVRGTTLGVIQLFSINEIPLNSHSLGVLQSVADIAALTIDQTHRIKQAHMLVSQLQGALDSRVVIEQAKGVIAERNKIDFSQAFHQLRSIARKEQRPIRSVASDIIALHHCSTSLKRPAEK